jgi:homocysteine S-methyltransferase
MGTLLRERAGAFRLVELLNLAAPEAVRAAHAAYRDAGSRVLVTNTFAANPLSLADAEAAAQCVEINRRGVALAREAAGAEGVVWGSVGPLALGLRLDDFPHERLVGIYAEQCRALAGVEALLLETFTDPRESAAALAAAVATGVPVVFQMGNTGRGATGRHRMELLLRLAEKAGVMAVGVNCRPPNELLEAVRYLLGATRLPVTAAPNAGNPSIDRGLVHYPLTPAGFLTLARAVHELGVALVAGCCGTTPGHIRAAAGELQGLPVRPRAARVEAASADHAAPAAAGAAVNPIRALMQSEAFLMSVEIRADRTRDVAAICAGALEVAAAGADLFDVPDKPGASVGRDAAVVAARLQEATGKPALAHRAALHVNLLEAHTALIGQWDLGLRGLLVLTGDPPSMGPLGAMASRVADLKSSVELLRLIRAIRKGSTLTGEPIRQPPDLCAGCTVGRPVPAHLEWLRKKLEAGAEFVYSQPVFDLETFERLRDMIAPLGVRFFPGVMPLVSRRNAEFLAGGNIPGIKVPDALVGAFGRFESAEDQRRFGLDHATGLALAIARQARGLYVIMPFGMACYRDSAALVRAVRAARPADRVTIPARLPATP